MLDCEQAQELAALYEIGDELAEAEQRALDKHLESCPDCAAYLEELEQETALLTEALQDALPGTIDAAETAETHMAETRAAKALALADPDLARRRFGELTAEAPTADIPWLGLFWSTRDTDRQTATKAALEAIARAMADADAEAYADVARFLDEVAPDEGKEAFRQGLGQLWQAGSVPSFVAVRFAVEGEEWQRLEGMVKALRESHDAELLAQVGELLSEAGKHLDAVALMEHAIRVNDPAPGENYTTLHWRAWYVFRSAGVERRLLALYENELSEGAADRGRAALIAAEFSLKLGDLVRSKSWLSHAGALDYNDTAWYLLDWAWIHLIEGDLSRWRDACRAAAGCDDPGRPGLGLGSRLLNFIQAIGDEAAVFARCVQWAYGELGWHEWWFYEAPVPTMIYMGMRWAKWTWARTPDPSQAVWVVVEALASWARHWPERVVGFAERLMGEYPDSLAATLAYLAISPEAAPDELQEPCALERLVLAGAEEMPAEELKAQVFTACGEAFLYHGEPDEAADALDRALALPEIDEAWRDRAKRALRKAREALPAPAADETVP